MASAAQRQREAREVVLAEEAFVNSLPPSEVGAKYRNAPRALKGPNYLSLDDYDTEATNVVEEAKDLLNWAPGCRPPLCQIARLVRMLKSIHNKQHLVVYQAGYWSITKACRQYFPADFFRNGENQHQFAAGTGWLLLSPAQLQMANPTFEATARRLLRLNFLENSHYHGETAPTFGNYTSSLRAATGKRMGNIQKRDSRGPASQRVKQRKTRRSAISRRIRSSADDCNERSRDVLSLSRTEASQSEAIDSNQLRQQTIATGSTEMALTFSSRDVQTIMHLFLLDRYNRINAAAD